MKSQGRKGLNKKLDSITIPWADTLHEAKQNLPITRTPTQFPVSLRGDRNSNRISFPSDAALISWQNAHPKRIQPIDHDRRQNPRGVRP